MLNLKRENAGVTIENELGFLYRDAVLQRGVFLCNTRETLVATTVFWHSIIRVFCCSADPRPNP